MYTKYPKMMAVSGLDMLTTDHTGTSLREITKFLMKLMRDLCLDEDD